MRMLLIDNYDSFTWNLAHLLIGAGADVVVRRNDAVTTAEAIALDPDCVVLSPGPGTPADAGCSADIVRAFAHRRPVFGVCLGMQVINGVFGGRTVRAPLPVHGKTCEAVHDGSALFAGVRNPFVVARYHSLAVTDVPPELIISARSDDGVPMALRHRALPVLGVQFHPESFMTPDGPSLARNLIRFVRTWRTPE